MVWLLTTGAAPTRLYYGTDTHSFGLTLGAVLAVISQRWSSEPLEWHRGNRMGIVIAGTVGFAGLAILMVLLPEDSPFVFSGGLALVAVATALAIAGSIVPGSFLSRVLDVSPMRWIGERSYGLYLWHWPAFVLLGVALPETAPLLIGLGALCVTVLGAALSYRFLEQPVRHYGVRTIAQEWLAAVRTRSQRTAIVAVATFATGALIVGSTMAVITAPDVGLAQERIEAGQATIDEQHSPTAVTPGTTTAAKPVAVPGGDQIYAIGDSVMLAAADEVIATFPGIIVDAAVNRRMSDAPAIVQALIDSGGLRPILLLGLGTNGPVDQVSIDAVAELVGYRTEIVLVNAQAPRGWIPGVNSLLESYAQNHRNVELANWYAAIQPRLDVLARDKIHAGGPIGGNIYAGSIKDALQRLAELPALLNNNDYGLTPRPV